VVQNRIEAVSPTTNTIASIVTSTSTALAYRCKFSFEKRREEKRREEKRREEKREHR